MAPRRINHTAVMLASAALLVAGCGGGSSNPGVAYLSARNSGTASAGAATGAGVTDPGSGSPEAAALAFAGCMRANGVPHFPRPQGRRRLPFSHGRRRRSLVARI